VISDSLPSLPAVLVMVASVVEIVVEMEAETAAHPVAEHIHGDTELLLLETC